MGLSASVLYLAIILLWIAILVVLAVYLWRNRPAIGSMRLAIIVLMIDAGRNVFENIYFGAYWSAVYGYLPQSIVETLGEPGMLILPKIANIVAGSIVLFILLLHWFPAAVRERAEAEARAAVAEQQTATLAAAMDASQVALAIVDPTRPSLPVVFANAAFLKLARRTAGDIIGRPVTLTALQPEARATLDRVLETGDPAEIEHRVVGVQGNEMVLRATLATVKGPDEFPLLLTIAAEDATEARRGIERDRRLQREEVVGQIAGSIAHDFNNLLTVMLGSLDTLRRHVEPKSRAASAVDLSMAAAERSSKLAQRLLAFSRPGDQGVARVDVNATIRDVQPLLATAATAAIGIEFDLTADPAIADLDRSRLEDALMNLCLNARDAMPNGGRLSIATHIVREPASGRETLIVEVSDTGEGMPPEIAARAFEPYFTTKTNGRGTGLGLPSVRAFVRECGGEVFLTSVPGAGTIVAMHLPRATAYGATDRGAAAAA